MGPLESHRSSTPHHHVADAADVLDCVGEFCHVAEVLALAGSPRLRRIKEGEGEGSPG